MAVRSMVFDRKWRDKTFDRLKCDLQVSQQARQVWFDDYRRSLRAYRCVPAVENKSWPWPNCSNLVPPMTTSACEQEIRRLVMFFIQDKEYVTLTGLRQGVEALGRSEKVQNLLRWQAESELNYIHWVDGFIREMVIGGTGIGEIGWAYEETVVADVMVLNRDRLVSKPGTQPMYQTIGQPVNKTTPVGAIFKELFESQSYKVGIIRRVPGGTSDLWKYEVDFHDDRNRKKTAIATIDRAEALGDQIEVTAVCPRVVKNQPFAINHTPEHVFVPPGDHGIQDAEFVGIRRYASWEYVQRRWETGEWESDEDEKAKLEEVFEDEKGLERNLRGKGQRGGWDDEMGAQDEQDLYVGVDSERFRSNKISVIEVKRRWDIATHKEHQDFQRPEAAITILPKFGMVVRAHYDSVDQRSGMRSLVAKQCVRARNEFYGISYPRMLESYQEELNAVVNLSIDTANVTSFPMMFLDHTAVIDRDKTKYQPGAVVRVSNPAQNVYFPQWPSKAGEFELQIRRLNEYGQDLAHHSPVQNGRDPALPNQNRTARGVQAIIAEGNFNVYYEAAMIAPTIQDFWKLVHAWDSAHMPPSKEIAIFGTDEIASYQVIRREDVRGDFDFRFEAGQAVLNDEMRRAMFTEAFQLTAAIAQAPPEQVPKPLWNMAREIWKQRGVRNPERFLPQPIDAFGDALSPEVEHQIFMMGRPVAVHPGDIDQLHLEAHMAFAQSDEFGKLPKSIVEAFNQHVLLHHRRIQAATAGGQGSVGSTGVQLGGRLALQGNPGINSSPGQPATVQPDQPLQPQGELAPL